MTVCESLKYSFGAVKAINFIGEIWKKAKL
jgi:hypothetical protein